MDLTFQVPIQYCFLQHQTLLSTADTFATVHCLCFGSAFSFLLKLFICSSPAAYWTSTNLEGSSFNVMFLLFDTAHGVLKAKILKWFAIPFCRSNCQHLLDHRKSKSSRKTSTFALLTMPKPLTVLIITNCEKFLRDGNSRLHYLPSEASVCSSRSNS